MKRIGYLSVMCAAFLTVALVGAAFATPSPNGAIITERTFNDCPLSTVTPVNAYPAAIAITDDMHPACVGWANLHSWSFSEDGGATATLFKNNSSFRFCATLTISGAGNAEGGLRLAPWWAPFVDGRFMARTDDPGDPFDVAEIACFGGRLPFYSFTGNHGITYVKGTPITMEITCLANGLSMASPATIQYRVTYNAVTYDSPVLPFDEGSVAEGAVYGNWGILHDARVGGYFQVRANTGVATTAEWTNICYENFDVVPTGTSTWGRLKTLYR
jgi:hypothetical protein